MSENKLGFGLFFQSLIFPGGDCLAISHRHADKRLIEAFIQSQSFMSGLLELDIRGVQAMPQEERWENHSIERLVEDNLCHIVFELENDRPSEEDNLLDVNSLISSPGVEFNKSEHLRYSLVSLIEFDQMALGCGEFRWLPPKVKKEGSWIDYESQKENSYYIFSVYGEDSHRVRHFLMNLDMDYQIYIPEILMQIAETSSLELSCLLHDVVSGFDRAVDGLGRAEALKEEAHTSVLSKIPGAAPLIKKAQKIQKAKRAIESKEKLKLTLCSG